MRIPTLTILPALLVLLTTTPTPTYAGPLAYGLCQASCATVVTACYAAAGAVWGTNPWLLLGLPVPGVILACNTAWGTGQAMCAAAFLLPTL